MLSKLAALAIIFISTIFMFKRVDVRLVLGLCAVGLFVLAGRLSELFVLIAKEMANDKTVVPICSAMGFAYVLKLTQCDRHLTHLLLAPLRCFRALLIPGGIAASYVVNMAIISQSSTAAIVGTVMVPLLLAVGIMPMVAGSLLLLGSSMGGELFNPGAVEIVTLTEVTGQPATEIVAQVLPLNLLSSVTALLVFCRLALVWERSHKQGSEASEATAEEPTRKTNTQPDAELSEKPFRVNLIKAAVPLLPLTLLFVVPAFVHLPKDSNSVSIAAAMFAGVAAAGLTSPKVSGRVPEVFFEGAGFAYANIISLIVVATIFTEGIKANGLIEIMTKALAHRPMAATFASILIPLVLAAATGSGSAPAVATIKVLVPIAQTMHLDPIRLGALIAVAAQLGRTMSPVAAVVMMSSTISRQTPLELVKRVALPLLAGGAAMLVAASLSFV